MMNTFMCITDELSSVLCAHRGEAFQSRCSSMSQPGWRVRSSQHQEAFTDELLRFLANLTIIRRTEARLRRIKQLHLFNQVHGTSCSGGRASIDKSCSVSTQPSVAFYLRPGGWEMVPYPASQPGREAALAWLTGRRPRDLFRTFVSEISTVATCPNGVIPQP